MPAQLKKAGLFDNLTAGIRFVFQKQILLSAISLDMFAVLFGGAVAMLPVFAAEVLHTGPQGLGFLRAAPAAGAVIMALILAHVPIQQNAGKKTTLCCGRFWNLYDPFCFVRKFLFITCHTGIERHVR